jgi:hypothetical protein
MDSTAANDPIWRKSSGNGLHRFCRYNGGIKPLPPAAMVIPHKDQVRVFSLGNEQSANLGALFDHPRVATGKTLKVESNETGRMRSAPCLSKTARIRFGNRRRQ